MAQLPLHDRRGLLVAHALLDDADAAWTGAWRWHRSATGYVVRFEGRRTVYLHRELLGLTHGDGKQGDHIDGDGLNCRRSNLRVVTHAENCQNILRRYGSSRHRGVSWHKGREKWTAEVWRERRKHFLGYFSDEADAAQAASSFRAEHLTHTNEARRSA